MRNVDLKYGAGVVRLRVPEERIAGVWSAADAVTAVTAADGEAIDGEAGRNRGSIEDALRELERSGLPELLSGAAGARRLGLLVADGTRAWDPRTLLGPVLAALPDGARGTILVATGTHAPEMPENRRLAAVLAELASAARPRVDFDVAVHDARRDAHRLLGTTSRGTRVELDERVLGLDAFLVLADMKYHYFAGFSNAVKYFVPGVASIETARGNHSLALEEGAVFGRHPWHPDAARRDNPLAADMVEAFELFRTRSGASGGATPCFALALVTSGEEIAWAGGGRIDEVSGRGMLAVDRMGSVAVPPSRFVVVSAGGAPHDESIYTVQRALELSRDAVRAHGGDRGEVLFLAACSNGLGPPEARANFIAPLERPLDEIRAGARADYALYSHKPVKFAALLRRLDALHVLSELDPDQVRRLHMQPTTDPQSVIDRWLARDDARGDRIAFLDDASKVAYVPMP